MEAGAYPTSTQTRCYINGYWVDDIVRIEFSDQNPKIPISGYNQKHTALVADAKYIVTGNLVINFRSPAYLLRAIERINKEEGKNWDGLEPSKRNRRTVELMTAIRDASLEDRARILAAATPDQFVLASQLLEAAFNAPPSQTTLSPVELGPGDAWNGADGIDLYVHYGYPSPISTEILIDVHFTSCQKVISASPGGGDLNSSGQPILEAYSFFAKRIERHGRLVDKMEQFKLNIDTPKISDLL